MRHRRSRLRAVVAALLLALGALFTTVGVASVSSSTSGPSEVASSSPREGAEPRHDVLAPRAPSVSSTAGVHLGGPHLDAVAAVAALAALLLLGWFVGERARRLLPRLGRRTSRCPRATRTRLIPPPR